MTNAFHNAKYRARHALGVEFVIFEDDRYRIDPAAGIAYDVAEFERLLDSARRRSADDPERVTELQRAVALYTGDYLTGVYSDWAAERRQALQSRYFDALNPLLDHLLRCREFEQALVLCRRGLELDFYREELHRGILLSLAETGRRAEALAHYKTFVQRLRRELRAAPSQATRDLIDRIRAQR